MRKGKARVDQSGFPPSLQIQFWPSTVSTQYRVVARTWGAPLGDGGRVVASGFLDVALPELAGLGLSETLELLQDKLHGSRAAVSADGGGFPPGPHRWSTATLPGL